MYVFRRTGFNVIKFIASVTLFFHFIGHLWHCMQDFLWGRSVISWERIIKTIYRSGAKLAIPLLRTHTISVVPAPERHRCGEFHHQPAGVGGGEDAAAGRRVPMDDAAVVALGSASVRGRIEAPALQAGGRIERDHFVDAGADGFGVGVVAEAGGFLSVVEGELVREFVEFRGRDAGADVGPEVVHESRVELSGDAHSGAFFFAEEFGVHASSAR